MNTPEIHEGIWKRLDRGRGQDWGIRVKGKFPRPGMIIQVEIRSLSGKSVIRDVRLAKVYKHHAMGIIEEAEDEI